MSHRRTFIACSTVSRQADPRSEAQAPLTVEPRKDCVAVFERADQLGAPRVEEHPGAAAMQHAVLVREGLEKPRFQPSSDSDHTLLGRLVKKMIQDVADRAGVRHDL